MQVAEGPGVPYGCPHGHDAAYRRHLLRPAGLAAQGTCLLLPQPLQHPPRLQVPSSFPAVAGSVSLVATAVQWHW